MQPLKLPLVHRTPFSVKDILDPTKFTKKISPTTAGKISQTLRGLIWSGVWIMPLIVCEFQGIPPAMDLRRILKRMEAAGRKRGLRVGASVAQTPRVVGSAPRSLWSSCSCWSTASRGATTCQCWSDTASPRPCASPRLR